MAKVFEENGWRVIYHPERKQPYTIWFLGQVEHFTESFDQAKQKIAEMRGRR